MSTTIDEPTAATTATPCATERLMRAAVSGLLAFGVAGCNDDSKDQNKANDELTDAELKTVCADMVDDAKQSVDLDKACAGMVKDAQSSVDLDKACADMVKDAQSSVDLDKACAGMVKDAKTSSDKEIDGLKDQCAPILLSAEEKSGKSEQKEYTFAALTKQCEDAGGYVEITASCAGENDCRGFSYGDWGPGGATLTEHTCSGVNGCNGLSCVVLPEDKGRTGKEIYEQKDPFGIAGPAPCNYCHATDWDEDKGTFNAKQFRVHQFPEGTRTADNWLDRPAAVQERIVAFGSHGVREQDGIGYRIMAGYKDVLSRAEVERVVKYVRTLEPVATSDEIIKIKD